MTFSQEWCSAWSENEKPYATPNPDLGLIIGHIATSSESGLIALELGCGHGSNYPIFKYHGIDYFGVDGSRHALDVAAEKYPEIRENLLCEDFTQMNVVKSCFNLVCDRAAVSHNDTKSIRRAIAAARDALVVGGVYIGVDWFSWQHTEFSRGTPVDERTRTDYPDGQFKGVGRVHFTDDAELMDIFSGFDLWMLRERTTRYPPGFPTENYGMPWVSPEFITSTYVSAVYDILARKM